MQYSALPTDIVRAYQAGNADAYDNAPEHLMTMHLNMQCQMVPVRHADTV